MVCDVIVPIPLVSDISTSVTEQSQSDVERWRVLVSSSLSMIEAVHLRTASNLLTPGQLTFR